MFKKLPVVTTSI